MSRRILAQVTAPAAATGVALFAVCLVSAWYVNNIQANQSKILKHHVASSQAAQQLEIKVRQLRFHCFLYLVTPSKEMAQQIKQDEKGFISWLQVASDTAYTETERELVLKIAEDFQDYQEQFVHLIWEAADTETKNFHTFAAKSPVNDVIIACRELMEENESLAQETAAESERLSTQLRMTMLLLGLAGPLGGILAGFGITRGLSRSIYRLSVHVKDMEQHLEHPVGSVKVSADGADIEQLDSQLERIVHRVEEVTEHLQRQQRDLLRAEQLSAVGKLAACVAHEVRNPLQAVKMLVGVALREQNSKPLTNADLRIIHEEVGRVEKTVQNLLSFARLPVPQPSRCDLSEVVMQATELLRARAEEQAVAIHLRGLGEPVPIHVDQGQLSSVLMNLFINALDAMPQGGRLDVELRRHNRRLLLRISDTGHGIPDGLLKDLFTPFITTKATGTGLGLSISKRIVEEHGGSLVAQNRPEGGACFTISLPERQAERTHAQAANH